MIDTKELQLIHLGQARDDYLRPQKIREEYDDTFTSVLGLRFEISRHHFRQGVIRLKCSSSLLTIYWQSSMVSTTLCKLDNTALACLSTPCSVSPS